eukprot:5012816-Prymnesium_polylepis.2
MVERESTEHTFHDSTGTTWRVPGCVHTYRMFGADVSPRTLGHGSMNTLAIPSFLLVARYDAASPPAVETDLH